MDAIEKLRINIEEVQEQVREQVDKVQEQVREQVGMVKEQVDSMATSVKEVAFSIGIRDILQPVLTYGRSKITKQHDPDFHRNVLTAYGYSKEEISGRSETVHCLILNLPVPESTLIAGHIFKHEWAYVSQIVLGVDIDDPRNGLPLFKPLQDAFDTLRLVILCE